MGHIENEKALLNDELAKRLKTRVEGGSSFAIDSY